MNTKTFTINSEDVGNRIDRFLSNVESLELTRSAIQNLMDKGEVSVNGKVISKNYKLRLNDVITLNVPEPEILNVVAENIPLNIVYEDEYLLVVDKPKGMVVHPAPSNYSGTLVNALMYHCKDSLSGINGVIRPGIVHRIDKNTSGLLIVAKTDMAHIGLAQQIKEHSFTREYEAIVLGRFKQLTGTVNAPIGRHPVDRKKMCVTEKNSKEAITHYEVLEQFEKHSHIKCILETGRTHQIRVHMAYVGHSVLGDDVYGKPYKNLDGQCLHAKKIGFIHPITKKYLEFDSSLPEYFQKALKSVGNNWHY
ncbi:MAG: RluA family pseudouridine synthase [Ruminococcus sp.]|nr:RluA family pseudouridine synthase [Ruminococcus sp.]